MQGNIYYVSNLGDDANSGTTLESPWKTLRKISSMTFNPGDHILLKSGNAWNEALILHGSGTADQPINVTAYGEGSKPKIHYGDGDVVILINEGGWCIKGLEIECITNEPIVPEDAETGLELTGGVVFTGNVTINRGIKVEYNKKGIWADILIADNIIHGQGINQRSEGIIIFASYGSEKREEVARNITISDNIVHDVGWRAIGTAGRDTDSQRLLPTSTLFHNVNIIGNTVYNIGVQGIVLGNSNHSTMKRNIVHDAGLYSGEGISWGPSGLWPICCCYVDIRFNEIYNMSNSNSGRDATGIDIDWKCDHVTVQNNYTHDNLGNGIVTMACKDSKIINNKVCGNDGKVNVGVGQIGLSDYTSDPSQTPLTGVCKLEISSNLILVDREETAALSSMCITPGNPWTGNIFINNDIVFLQGIQSTSVYNIGEKSNIDVFEGNRFYGIKESEFTAIWHDERYEGFQNWEDNGYDAKSCFLPVDSTLPTNVAGFVAEKILDGYTIQLRWKPAVVGESGISHYNLYRSIVSDFSPSYRTMISEVVDTSFTDSEALEESETYYYKIEAEDRCGNVSPVAAVACVTISTE